MKTLSVFVAFLLSMSFVESAHTQEISKQLLQGLFGVGLITETMKGEHQDINFWWGPAWYSSLDSFDNEETGSAFGVELTPFAQEISNVSFEWGVGWERLGRRGKQVIDSTEVLWRMPVNGVYTGPRLVFHTVGTEKDGWGWSEPFVYVTGGLYALSDILAPAAIIVNNDSFDLTSSSLAVAGGAGFYFYKKGRLWVGIDAGYRWMKFENPSLSIPSGKSLPSGFTVPSTIDYNNVSVAILFTFLPQRSQEAATSTTKEGAAGQIPKGNTQGRNK